MVKNIVKFILFLPLLMAFQCEDEFEESTLVINVYTAAVTPESSFWLTDTIWISGKVSVQAFDLSVNDSVFNENPQADVFSIYKFIEPTAVANCVDAIDKFEIIIDKGEITFLPACENAQLQAFPEPEKDNLFYSYRIGLKPMAKGDFVISWQDGIIQNADRNEFIIANYAIVNHPNQIGFSSCGSVSWRYLCESDKEYYFTIE